ncbi:MAG: carbon-phosphorus lyase complex subunit PhnI [Ilumatobacteraceae bacterium]|jgi:alpha-D-ribose 1-methylphosphonate 5-triphosphate synthase subunit PhnI
MGYAAARGGLRAIRAAEALVRRLRLRSRAAAPADDQLIDHFGPLVDRVMGEGGVWDPVMAAAALRQGGGDPIEAAHLIRARRSTLAVLAVAVADADEVTVLRRVVPAYRNPPGPQLLGATSDYTGRVLEHGRPRLAADEMYETANDTDSNGADGWREDRSPARLLDLLRGEDLVVDRRRTDDPDPVDITRVAARPPAPRSARLSAMARAETGGLVNQWYRNILGPDGYLHEITLGEVRHGRLPVRLTHPYSGEPVCVTRVRVTEVEAIEDLDGVDEDRSRLDVGYGLCFGHNEKKAIAMANLDIACHRDGGRTQLEQSLLLTTDGLEATGFLEHLKLPHYVTFRSILERKVAVREARSET